MAPPFPSPAAGRKAPRVRIYTLGRFSIEIDGKTLPLASRQPRKPLALLKVLISLGGRDVAESRVSDVLWPESEGHHAHRSFTTTLYRLRKLLGRDALRLQGGRLTLMSEICWVDALALPEQLLHAAIAADAEDDATAWEQTERAVGLYAGSYLEGEYDPLEVVSARRRIHDAYLRGLDRLGQLWIQKQQYDKGIYVCERGLEADELAEELYRQLMHCYQCQGQTGEGIRVYQRCREVLRARTDSDPATETESLHRILIAERDKQSEADVVHDERRVVTIAVFSVSGYSEMSRTADPEIVDSTMRRIKEELGTVVMRHGGAINQTLRDEMICVFGLPTAHEDDAVRAVRAARGAQGVVRRIYPAGETQLATPLELRAGIATGLVVTSRTSDSDGRYGLTGEVANIAARLADEARPDEILLSSTTNRLIAPYFETRPLAGNRARSTSESHNIHVVVRESMVDTHFDAAKRRGLTPFVGRVSELGRLHACLHKAIAGAGRTVAVEGEAGVGKSRLLYEFGREVAAMGALVIEGRCQAYGSSTPYLPFVHCLLRLLELEGTEPAHEREKSAISNILAIDPALESYLPYYLHLLSLPTRDHPLPESLERDELRRAMQEALSAIIVQKSARQPVVAILEDWHWADESSEKALTYLSGLVPFHSLLLVASYRPDTGRRWQDAGQITPLVLTPMDATNSEAMLRKVLDANRLPDGFSALIYEQTGGNPFFIEELCNNLREDGVLFARTGQIELTRPVESLKLPATVQGVIRSRLDRMNEGQLDMLRVASVIGREFSGRLLEAVHGEGEQLDPIVEALKNQDVLQQTHILPQVVYRFKHVLTQVVVYETLLLNRRRELHKRVAEAIEILYEDQVEEHLESLAHHYHQGGEPDRAIHYLELAGDKAAKSYSTGAARKHYRECLDLLDERKPVPDIMRRRIAISLKFATVSYYVTPEKQLSTLEISLNHARALQDDTLEARVTYWMGRAHHILGNANEAIRLFERVVEKAEHLGDDEILALSYTSIGRASLISAEFGRGIEYLEQGIALLKPASNRVELAYSTSFLGLIQAHLGNFGSAHSLQDEALQVTKSIGNLTYQSSTMIRVALCRLTQGHWRSAISACDEAIDIAEHIGDSLITGFGKASKAYPVFMRGDREGGIALSLEGIEMLETHGSHLAFSYYLALLAELCALAGDRNRAVTTANRALSYRAMADKQGDHIAFRSLALAAATEDSPDWHEVDMHMRRCLQLARGRRALPHVAVSSFRFAELLNKKGDLPRAKKYLNQAANLFSEMEMIWWQKRAETLNRELLTLHI